MADPPLPAVVALDGGLSPADLPAEMRLLRVARLTGNAPLVPDPDLLPLDEPLATWLRAEAATGRRILLAGDMPAEFLSGVAARIAPGLEVLPVGGGAGRLSAIRARLGDRPFAFAGTARADAPVRAAAAMEIALSPPPSPALFRALRPHHWIKNLLVFLPLLAAHRWGDAALWGQAGLAFAAFCLCSSAVYLTNDLLDIEDDRAHPQKRNRPLASGALAPAVAMIAAIVLLAVSCAVAAAAGVLPEVSLYAVASLAYSLRIKTLPVADLFWLVGLYSLRVLAGGAATGIVTSVWLLAAGGFVFASLVCAKRCTEMTGAAAGALPVPRRRGYRPKDRGLLTAAGLAAAFATQIVLLLYLQEAQSRALYAHPGWLAVAGLVILAWLIWVWFLVSRNRMQSDPIVFALRDRTSLAAAAAVAGAFVMASGV